MLFRYITIKKSNFLAKILLIYLQKLAKVLNKLNGIILYLK